MKFVKMTMSISMQIIQQVPDTFDEANVTEMTDAEKEEWKTSIVQEYSQSENIRVLDANIDRIEVVTV